MKYYVVQHYYDTGRVKMEVETELTGEAQEAFANSSHLIETDKYDLRVDEFDTKAQAYAFTNLDC